MLFARIVPDPPDFDLDTLKCAICGRVHKVITAADPLKITVSTDFR